MQLYRAPFVLSLALASASAACGGDSLEADAPTVGLYNPAGAAGAAAPSSAEALAYCPEAEACPAPAAPAACPEAKAAEPIECPVCPAPAPSSAEAEPTTCPNFPEPTTLALSDAWPIPNDDPHHLEAFCEAELMTYPDGVNMKTITAVVGCGDVNDARFGHLNVEWTTRRFVIDEDTGATAVVDKTRTCYGPHGGDYTEPCVVGKRCKVTYHPYLFRDDTFPTIVTGTCVAR